MLCPDCGVETQDLLEGSCARCFVRRNPIAEVPLVIDVLLCATCHARRKGEHWLETKGRGPIEMRDEAVLEHVRVHKYLEAPSIAMESKPQDARNFAYDIMVDGVLAGLPVDTLITTVARVQGGVCRTCSREAGGYFSAIIQFRGSDREPTDKEREETGNLIIRMVDKMRKSGNANAFLTKQGKVQGGHDFYLSEIDVGRIISKKIAEKYDASVEEAAKLVGRENGSDLYRVTFLVRIPAYRRGDFVLLPKGPAMVLQVNAKTVNLRDLLTGRIVGVPRDRVKDNDVLAHADSAKEMMVVSVVRDEALLLDPVTNKTHEVKIPDDITYDLSIRNFETFEHDGQVYVVGVPKKSSLPLI